MIYISNVYGRLYLCAEYLYFVYLPAFKQIHLLYFFLSISYHDVRFGVLLLWCAKELLCQHHFVEHLLYYTLHYSTENNKHVCMDKRFLFTNRLYSHTELFNTYMFAVNNHNNNNNTIQTLCGNPSQKTAYHGCVAQWKKKQFPVLCTYYPWRLHTAYILIRIHTSLAVIKSKFRMFLKGNRTYTLRWTFCIELNVQRSPITPSQRIVKSICCWCWFYFVLLKLLLKVNKLC